jgi:hypothetical protein
MAVRCCLHACTSSGDSLIFVVCVSSIETHSQHELAPRNLLSHFVPLALHSIKVGRQILSSSCYFQLFLWHVLHCCSHLSPIPPFAMAFPSKRLVFASSDTLVVLGPIRFVMHVLLLCVTLQPRAPKSLFRRPCLGVWSCRSPCLFSSIAQ